MRLLKGTKRRWIWAGAAFLLGLVDYLLLRLFGVSMYLGEWDVTFWVVVLFSGNFAGLGWVIGALLDHRAELEEQAQLIRDQYDELQATQRRALENEKLAAVGRLAAGVAHEVRNPLGVIRSSADMLGEELVEEDSKRAAAYICEEVDRLDDFVERLLDFTRPMEPRLESVVADELVERAVRETDGRFGEGVDVATEIDANGRLEVDPELTVRLLSGLLGNARDALGDEGRVAIRVRETEEGARFEVADDGPGVPESARSDVFEPFHTTKSDGTGLGLAMARKIAEVHGGTLEYVPDAGLGDDDAGACFRFELPASEGVPNVTDGNGREEEQ